MKFRKILLLLLILSLSVAAQEDKITTMPMLRAIQSADFEPIMPYMNSKLEIILPDYDSNIVSKTQGKAILSDYFKRNKMIFAGFKNKNIQKNLQNLTYISKTENKNFTVFVLLKDNKIIKIKIEPENVW
jgi:hypothetical protein